MRNVDCSSAGDLIPEFLAGRLSSEEEEKVRAHITTCSDCRQRANAVSLLQQTPIPVPDQDRWDQFVGEIVDATEARAGAGMRRRAWRVLAVLAAAAIIVLSWVRLGDLSGSKRIDLESLACEVAELPDAEAAAWTAGLTSSGFMTAGFAVSELGDAEIEQLATEVGRL